MRYFTKEWFWALQESGSEDDPQVDDPPKEYLAELKRQKIPERILDRLDFHDSEVLEISRDAEKLVLRMEDRGWGYCHITFARPEIRNMDDGLAGCEWLYEEIYRAGGGYEMHVLFFSRKELGLKELIIRCRDIVIA